ncbi:MAG TPA: LacI family DNA-binding transcriptional regulator [Bacilli bacterium]
MITIYDVAKKANVSAMTVSRVINNTGRISEPTRNRVKKVMLEMNYVQNSLARGLVLQETKILSLLIADITNPFYTTIARGAEDTAKQLGYKLLFGNSDEDYAKEKDYVEMILSTRVDGVLFAPAGDHSQEHLELLAKYKVPFVILDREVPEIQSDMVLGDSKDGARKLIEYLIQLGHRRIAMINGSLDVSTARYRYAGYEEALMLNQIKMDPDLVFICDYKALENDTSVEKLLSLSDRPTAIFAANNMIAIGAVRSLRNRGLRVPEDISVVCFDDLGIHSVLDPFFTVAAQPAYQLGSIGIELLIKRIQGGGDADWKKVTLPSELIIRRSSM